MRTRWPLAIALLGALAARASADPALALTVDDAMKRAASASGALHAAEAGADRAHAGVTAAKSGYFPDLTGSASYQRTIFSEFQGLSLPSSPTRSASASLPFGRPNTWRVGVDASQLLYDEGRTAADVDAAQAGEDAARLGVSATRAQLVLAVAVAYYDAALADRQVAIASDTLAQAEETYRQAKLSYDQQAAPEFDVVRAEVARDNQQELLTRYTEERDVAFDELRRAIGLPLDRALELTSALDDQQLDQLDDAARAAAGIRGTTARVPVAIAEDAARADRATARAARAARWPVFAIQSQFGLVDYPDGATPDSDWRKNWTVTVGLTVPLFDGLRTEAQIDQAEADADAADARAWDATRDAEVDSRKADADVKVASSTFTASAATVAEAQRAYDIAKLRWQQGVSSHLELVDSRVQLEEALLDQAKSARDLRVAEVRRALLPALPLVEGGQP